MADNELYINLYDLIQNNTAVPVCRVHVYKRRDQQSWTKSAKLPVSWVGKRQESKGDSREIPHLIIGREGMYLQKTPFEGLESSGLLSKNKAPQLYNPVDMPWQVLSCRVNQTRQWSCSSCNLQIAAGFDNSFDLVTMNPPIAPNDVIVIEMGYVKSIRSKITFDYTPGKTSDEQVGGKFKAGNTDYGKFAGDVVFYGIVDTVKERGGSGEGDGIVYTILARDAMSLLVDNKIRGQYNPGTLDRFNRAYVIRDLIRRGAAINYVLFEPLPNSDDEKAAVENPGQRKPKITNGVVSTAQFTDENCCVRIGNIEFSKRVDLPPASASSVPEASIVLMDRFPIDVIKHFSLVETAPRELWADQRNGDIHWMFRRSDVRRLANNTTRKQRQYFYRFPVDRANILSYTAEWSTAGTVTHFTLTNPRQHLSNTKQVADIYVEGKTAELRDPHCGEKLRPIIRNRFIYDDTLNNSDEAAVIADALFYIWGRTIETGMVMILGDPTLEISEGVQIYNTGLFGRRYLPGRKMTGAALDNWPNSITTTDIDVNSFTSGLSVDQYSPMNPEGVYRVEAITHMFATGGVQQGFKTIFVFGPLDDNAGDPKRLITREEDLNEIALIDNTENYQGYGNDEEK